MTFLIVDDHPLFRQGLRMLLLALKPNALVEEAGDLKEEVVPFV